MGEKGRGEDEEGEGIERKLDLEVLWEGKYHYENSIVIVMQSWLFLARLIGELEVRTDTSVFP